MTPTPTTETPYPTKPRSLNKAQQRIVETWEISPEAAPVVGRYQQLEEARLQQPDQAPQRQDRADPRNRDLTTRSVVRTWDCSPASSRQPKSTPIRQRKAAPPGASMDPPSPSSWSWPMRNRAMLTARFVQSELAAEVPGDALSQRPEPAAGFRLVGQGQHRR